MATESRSTLKDWFRRTLKPTQEQFWSVFDSFWHKSDVIPTSIADSSVGSAKLDGSVVQLIDSRVPVVDDEDLKIDANTISLKDRASLGDREGYFIIRQDFDFGNIPASYANAIWEIRYLHDLAAAAVVLPANVTLKFNGGFLENYTSIQGNDTLVETGNQAFDGIGLFTGTWNNEKLTAKSLGLKGDGVTDDTDALQKAIDFCSDKGISLIFENSKIYRLTGGIVINNNNLKKLTIKGNGSTLFLDTPATHLNQLFYGTPRPGSIIDIEGLKIDLNENSNNCFVFRNGFPIDDNSPSIFVNKCEVINGRRVSSNSQYGAGAIFFSGAFNLVSIKNSVFRNFYRNAGAGIPSSIGCHAVSITETGANYPKKIIFEANTIKNVYTLDFEDSPENVDCDGLLIFSKYLQSPLVGTEGEHVSSTIYVAKNSFENCSGRAIKVQATHAIIRDNIIERNAGYGIAGATDINPQLGSGQVLNNKFIYRQYDDNGTIRSPISEMTVISGFFGSVINKGGAFVVKDNEVYSYLTETSGKIGLFCGIQMSSAAVNSERGYFNISGNHVYGECRYFFAGNADDRPEYGNISNNFIEKMELGMFNHNGSHSGSIYTVENNIHKAGILNDYDKKAFIHTEPVRPFNGLMQGSGNHGFSWNRSLNGEAIPRIHGELRPSNSTGLRPNIGASARIESGSIGDDEEQNFGAFGYTAGLGMVMITVAFSDTTQGLYVCGGAKATVVVAKAGHLFQSSTANTNPDVDGKINVWVNTLGELMIKNRLGSSRVFSVFFFA